MENMKEKNCVRAVLTILALAVIASLLATLTGCVAFSTNQTDVSTEDPKTHATTRTITTKASARSFAAGKQALANWKASQTDKTQGASVGSISQETDAKPLMEALGEAVAKGFISYMTGGASSADLQALLKILGAAPKDNPSKPQPEFVQPYVPTFPTNTIMGPHMILTNVVSTNLVWIQTNPIP